MDAKLIAVIGDMNREELADVLDEALGVGCLDERDIDDLRAEVQTLYVQGLVTSETLLATYSGGL